VTDRGESRVDRLLLVDDNPTNLQVLFQALEQEGYELLIAQSGQEALEIAREAHPKLILLDINMPGMDGYETCQRLKSDSRTKDSVVVFLSARGDVNDKVRGLELGAIDYIEKPFQFEEVLARVRQHLSTYDQHRQLRHENKQLKELIDGGFRELASDDLLTLMEEGESDRVEFKSTLRMNLHTGKNDKRMENACLKTVAAFMNSDGGFLLIGVDDEGQSLGLDHDGFDSEDRLLLHWNGLIKQYLGVQVSPRVRSTVVGSGGKRVLAVQCLTSSQPVFFRRDQDEIFFVRTGNGSHALKPSEVLLFLDQRTANQSVSPVRTTESTNRLGQYTLGEKIGAGGMGMVYRARHALLSRPAAIKLLDMAKADERMIERFQREVQLSSQLTHPNTITIYDYGRTSDGAFYYVMELIDGLTLEELVKENGPLPEGRAIQILKQVCGSLAEAHEAGLIHRDIKPANIMISYCAGLGDFVRVLDFGLVKPVDRDGEVELTRTGALSGSPLYISPEGVERADEVTALSDLYSLGATAYYLLTGSPVFEGKNPFEVCLHHLTKTPTSPAEKRQAPIDEALERLVMNCLAKQPEDRPGSARELLSALSSCTSAGSWTLDMSETWWAKQRE
jgi:DNA-binding response OmpR family regulator